MRIEDDLMQDLKQRAQQERTSVTKLINRVLRHGLRALETNRRPVRPLREKTFAMGQPKMDLDRALALVAMMEDEETSQELARRK